MVKNYLKIALRNFWRHKFISLINLIGLSLGIAIAILAFLFIQDEFRTDRFHQNANRIYQVVLEEKNLSSGEIVITEAQPYPLAPSLHEDIPEVTSFVRFRKNDYYIKIDNQAIKETVVFADSTLFQVFDFPLMQGNPKFALVDAFSVAISKTKAQQFFGDINPIGQTIAIRLNNEYTDFRVTSVFEDIPSYSSIQAEIIIPMHQSVLKLTNTQIFDPEREALWYVSSFKTFVLLHSLSKPSSLADKLADVRATYYPDEAEYFVKEKKESGNDLERRYHLRPLADVYFSSSYMIGKAGSKPVYSYVLASIAGGILLMACFNYLTLSIGRASKRIREIGIRKVVGARRRQIAYQFTSEAVILSILSSGIALILVIGLLPLFNQLADKALTVTLLAEPLTMVAIIGVSLVTGLLSGIYPAVYLSSIPTLDTFVKKFALGRINIFTQVLVTFQFCLPIVFLVATLAMIYQLQFMRSEDLGFDDEHVLVIENNAVNRNQAWEQFQQWAKNNDQIVSTAFMDGVFTKLRTIFYFRDEAKQAHQVSVYHISDSFFETIGLSLEQGRWFNPNLASDSTESIVVNEEFTRAFGWANPLGKEIEGRRVIGVLEDFHIESLSSAIPPVAFYLTQDQRDKRHFLAKLSSDNLARTLSDIDNLWQNEISDSPFIYSFMDKDFNALYQQEERWKQIMQWVAIITVIIAALGLIGLTALAAAGREKEIGIRKVLGAPVASILVLLSKDFFRLVLIALIIAIPIANYAITEWLAGFAYRVDVQWWLFAIPAGLILLVALLSVSHQTLKAATRNPVDSLRYE
ncbi:MAG: ABC transporter permease [Bacteroidota bacterium]